MVCGIATELLCSLCDEVCKRGAQMKCFGIRACRSCAVLKIIKIKKCWNEECDKEDIVPSNDLKNDDLLRKAVEHFLKNGKMDPAHEKMLKKTGKKTIIGKDGEVKAKKPPVDFVEKFNQPCGYGDKCRRKGCLFVHGKPTLTDNKKAGEAREKGNGKPATLKKSAKAVDKPVGNGKPCKFGALCSYKDTCKFVHPKTNKMCRFGAGCSSKSCKFDHSPSSKALDRAMSKFTKGIKPMGGDLRFILVKKRAMSGGMGGGMGGMASMNMSLREMEWNGFGENAERRNINLEKMLNMKEELDSMLADVMGSRRSVSDGRRGGYGSSFMGRSVDRMNVHSFAGRSENKMDGRSFMGRSEDRMNSSSFAGRSDNRIDGRSFTGRSEDRMNGSSFMGRSENRMDGRNWYRGYGGASGRSHF